MRPHRAAASQRHGPGGSRTRRPASRRDGSRGRCASIFPSELHFTTGNTIESSECSIKEITPASGAVDVPLDSAIVVNFNQSIDFANMNWIVLRDSSKDIPGKYSISTDRKKLLWTPTVPLTPLMDYYFTVDDGSISCLASSGNHLYKATHFKTAAQ